MREIQRKRMDEILDDIDPDFKEMFYQEAFASSQILTYQATFQAVQLFTCATSAVIDLLIEQAKEANSVGELVQQLDDAKEKLEPKAYGINPEPPKP